MEDKTLFALMCILCNAVGVPCFMQGKVRTGVWRIILGHLTFGVIFIINFVKGITLGIKVFKMTEEEYSQVKGNLDNGIPSIK